MTSASGQGSSAVRLLHAVLTEASIHPARVAWALGVTTNRLEQYRAGTSRMPVECQLKLAQLVVDHLPHLARAAHRLRAQAKAEARFNAQETTTHLIAPPSPFR